MPLLWVLKLRHFTGGWSSKGDTSHFLATICTPRFHGRFGKSGYMSLLVGGVPATEIISGAVSLSPCMLRMFCKHTSDFLAEVLPGARLFRGDRGRGVTRLWDAAPQGT